MFPDPCTDDIKFVDLCAGLGGFHLALSTATTFLSNHAKKELTFTCVAASELQTDLRECYVRNFPELSHVYASAHSNTDVTDAKSSLEQESTIAEALPRYSDNGRLEAVHGDMACFLTNDQKELRMYPSGKSVLPAHDLLCAGFPCQPFSKSGAQRGFDDTRGTVFHMIATMLRHQRPAFVLLENVGNFEKHDEGNTWRRVREILEVELGYDVVASEHLSARKQSVGLLSPHHIGFPHHRERFFIVAQRRTALDGDSPIVRSLLQRELTSACLPSRNTSLDWMTSPEDRARETLRKIISSEKNEYELIDLKQAQVSAERVACINHWQKLLNKLKSIDEVNGSTTWRDSMPSFPIWGYELDPWNWYDCETNPSTCGTTISQRRSSRQSNLVTAHDKVSDASKTQVLLLDHPPLRSRAWLASLNEDESVTRWVSTWPAYASRRLEWPSWKRRFILQNRAWAIKVWAEVGGAWMREWLDELFESIPAPSNQKLEWNCKGEELSLWSQILQFRPSGLRVKRLVHVPALVAMTTTQVPIVPRLNPNEPSKDGNEGALGRHLVRSEALQLQGFPPNWSIPTARERAFACFGNAVHAGLVASILVNWLNGDAIRTNLSKLPSTTHLDLEPKATISII